ncbi:replication initiation protein [Hymenobacter sp. YC55]|uniref:replication initiation protein n=1 Tax=Hymenobacter sp. YC55 TaxID=3034019 RepID=UPI0023F935A6|nr:replication initiation protein [Hymenobacter sp. YC55]MDF7814823.1 replication initiation protein [Hymenobacter sp. YC55]
MQTNLFDPTPTPELPVSKIVVQHNALVNARFDLSTVEMRLFMAMLSRIGRDDSEFREMRIPLTEVVALSGRRPSSKDYQQVAGMCNQLVSRILHIERPNPARRANRKNSDPDFDKIPLMAYAKYRGEEGALHVRFNDEVMPYLLQLQRNFTKAQVVQLLKLKSPHSYRIYWLLKEYSAFGTRTIGVDQLKALLNLEGQYKQFPLFRLRVLDRAQLELAKTDLPFEYDLIRQGKGVAEIKFRFTSLAAGEGEALLAASSAWEEALLQAGVAAASIVAVGELIERGEVEPGYVQYVVQHQRSKSNEGKIKSLAGAIVSAITKKHLTAEYKEAQKRSIAPARKPAPARQDSKEVRYRLDELPAIYQTMVRKNLTTASSFEEHFQSVYLDQGFVVETDGGGVQWAVKRD